MKSTYFEPRYVLALPISQQVQYKPTYLDSIQFHIHDTNYYVLSSKEDADFVSDSVS